MQKIYSSKQLEERLKKFALRVARLVKALPKNPTNRVYGYQVIKSSSSMGANYAEATCAHTKKDFTHDINRCRKEAKESLYWLNLFCETNEHFRPRMEDLIKESEELVKIFQSAVSTAKSR